MPEFLNVNPNEVVIQKKNSDSSVPFFQNKRSLTTTPPPDPCAEYEDTQK
jgi:hypothetical protein